MERGRVQVRVFGSLRDHMKRNGLPCQLEFAVESDGRTAGSVAEELGLPTAKVEAAFLNGRVRGLDVIVRPGDRLAFVPYGTPGPHRIFLGMVRESRRRKDRDRTDQSGRGSGA